jgi:Fe2+ or Zn2+ uptake regulation protein
MNSYYNTNGLYGADLFMADKRATTQEDLILDLFVRMDRELTPFEVQELLGNKYPITSVRRAITNLTKQGKLEKTTTRKSGVYGQLNYCWKVK